MISVIGIGNAASKIAKKFESQSNNYNTYRTEHTPVFH